MAKINVTTKGGDKGTTALGSGERVPKDDARVELYGTLDECQAALGLARALCRQPQTAEEICFLEDYLCGAMAYFAGCDFPTPDPAIMENMADRLSEKIAEGFSFTLPGESVCGAALHLARTVARRAERVAAPLYRDGVLDEKSFIFLNRLSDVIYILSLKACGEENAEK